MKQNSECGLLHTVYTDKSSNKIQQKTAVMMWPERNLPINQTRTLHASQPNSLSQDFDMLEMQNNEESAAL
jgi:hypothetical protein